MSNEAGVQIVGDEGSSGTKLGGTTSSLLGFYGTTPVAKPGATTDLGTVLSNLGLRASGTAYPITTSGAVALTGTFSVTDITVTNDITISDAGNIILKTTTGTKIGTAVTQKLGFYNATPVVQPSGASQAAVTTSITTTKTTTNIAATVANLITLTNALRTALVNLGLAKGAA